jgi:hypothetical protein
MLGAERLQSISTGLVEPVPSMRFINAPPRDLQAGMFIDRNIRAKNPMIFKLVSR